MSTNENTGQQNANASVSEFDASQKRRGDLPIDAQAVRRQTAVVQGPVDDTPHDWRVSLEVPTLLLRDSEILSPLSLSNNRMVFPFTPTIILGHSANYSQISPTHSNYPFYAYQNSQVDTITINGDFFTENEEDAKYWLACIHFLRTMTKMFYGDEGSNSGKPPLMSRLNGYGSYVMNNVPILITSFTTDLPADVDYIPCTINNKENYVPAQSTITVQVAPNYARRSVAGFNLQDYANGTLVGKQEGFI